MNASVQCASQENILPIYLLTKLNVCILKRFTIHRS